MEHWFIIRCLLAAEWHDAEEELVAAEVATTAVPSPVSAPAAAAAAPAPQAAEAAAGAARLSLQSAGSSAGAGQQVSQRSLSLDGSLPLAPEQSEACLRYSPAQQQQQQQQGQLSAAQPGTPGAAAATEAAAAESPAVFVSPLPAREAPAAAVGGTPAAASPAMLTPYAATEYDEDEDVVMADVGEFCLGEVLS